MPKEEPVDKKNSLAFLRRRGKKKKKTLYPVEEMAGQL